MKTAGICWHLASFNLKPLIVNRTEIISKMQNKGNNSAFTTLSFTRKLYLCKLVNANKPN